MVVRILMWLGCCVGVGVVGGMVKKTIYSPQELAVSLKKRDQL